MAAIKRNSSHKLIEMDINKMEINTIYGDEKQTREREREKKETSHKITFSRMIKSYFPMG